MIHFKVVGGGATEGAALLGPTRVGSRHGVSKFTQSKYKYNSLEETLKTNGVTEVNSIILSITYSEER